MPDFGVVLVGCGTVAGYGHLPAIESHPNTRLVGVADVDPDRAQRACTEYGAEDWSTDYRDFLGRGDVEVVVITTPPDSHARIAIDALHAGKNVLCEKPFARSLSDAREIIRTVRQTGRKLTVGYVLRHNAAYRKAAEMIRDGAVGSPLVMRLLGSEGYTQVPKWNRALGLLKNTSPVVDCGCHYADVMRWFTGAEATSVCGVGGRLNPEVPAAAYDYGSIQVQFDDGSVGTYEVAWGYTFRNFSEKEFIGPEGRLRIEHISVEEGKEDIQQLETYVPGEGLRTIPVEGSIKPMAHQLSSLIDHITDDLDPLPALADAVKSLEIVLAGHEAILTGKHVSFPYEGNPIVRSDL
ncbi:MAG: Gfo/Idh/MocA family oxidoreductase [Candidatus Latescibacterota bacterium]